MTVKDTTGCSPVGSQPVSISLRSQCQNSLARANNSEYGYTQTVHDAQLHGKVSRKNQPTVEQEKQAYFYQTWPGAARLDHC